MFPEEDGKEEMKQKLERIKGYADKGNQLACCQYALAILQNGSSKEDIKDARQYLMKASDDLKFTDSEDIQKLALECLKNSAGSGNLCAIFNTALAYQTGRGTKADSRAALDYYKRAANLGHPESAVNYGQMLSESKNPDRAKIVTLYKMAAEANVLQGMYNYALYLEKGWGVSKRMVQEI